MAIFLWEAKSRQSEIKRGEMEAQNAEVVNQRLRSLGLHPLRVKRKAFEIRLRWPGSTGVGSHDLVVFTRQLATMVDAGLPLLQCLDILTHQQPNPDFKKILFDVRNTVESGSTLADALRRHPKVFDRLFLNLVAAGEAGGVLDTILNRLASYIESNQQLVKKVRGALVYPVLTLSVALVVTAVMLTVVIPVYQKMFSEFGSALPAPTQFVIYLSNTTRANIHWLTMAILGLFLVFFVVKRSPRGHEALDGLLLKLPIFGPLLQKISVAKFTRTLGTMLSSAVPILDALDIVASASGNLVIERGLRIVRTKISEGKSMAEPLAELPAFPPMVVQMIAVGESTGALDAMLNKIGDFYDDEVNNAISTMLSVLEPMMMGFLAILLGGLVISMYLPIFSLASVVG